MNTFRVWAPLPQKVELRVGGRTFPMHQEHGWWSAHIEDADGEMDYGFLVDGQGPFPDPRSPWQPQGVHGLSRTKDHGAFKWCDSGFKAEPLSNALFYEVHTGTFTPEGTFDAAISKLDYLRDLGVTHVQLMPVNAFPGRHGWGYDGVAIFAVHHPYGGPEALKRFVSASHARGLAVVLDVVYNHLGPSGNYTGKFGPYFNPSIQTPWGSAVNFSGPQSDEIRRFFCDNALMWLRDYHLDGLRLDAVHAIMDTSAMHFLEQLASEVADLSSQLGRELLLIPESDLNDPRLLLPPARGGFGLTAQWSDDFHHALHTLLTGEKHGHYEDFGRMAELAKALTNAYVFDGQLSSYRQRHHGRPRGDLCGHSFLGYLQNHDQVGNRPRGRRLSGVVDAVRVKLGAAVVLASPFVPMLFMGEEWAASTPFIYFADHQEPELAKAVSEGRRREFAAFGWKPEDIPDPEVPATFEVSKLDWSELDRPPHSEMCAWYGQLIELRRNEPSLTDGRLDLVKVHFDESARWLVSERGPITVACNFSDSEQVIPIRPGRHSVVLSSVEIGKLSKERITLPGWGVAILKL